MKDKPIMGDIEYRLAGGNKCPVCDENDVEGGPVDIDGGWATQSSSCAACGHEWTDYYKLQGFSGLKDEYGNVVNRGPTPLCISDKDLQLMFDAAANGYANDEQDDTISWILTGEDVQDKLAEFIVNEIRDVSLLHTDEERIKKFREVLEAVQKAGDTVYLVWDKLAELTRKIEDEV